MSYHYNRGIIDENTISLKHAIISGTTTVDENMNSLKHAISVSPL